MAAPARTALAEIRRTHEALLATDDPGFAYSCARAWQVLALVEAVEAAQAYIAKYDSAGSGRQSWAVSRSQRETLRAALASFGEPAA